MGFQESQAPKITLLSTSCDKGAKSKQNKYFYLGYKNN